MKWLAFFLIAVMTFVGFVLVLAPASLVWRSVNDQVLQQVPDLHVLRVGGTVWQGDAELVYRQFPASILNWQLKALPLVKQQAEVTLTLAGDGHELSTSVMANQQQAKINSFSGYVDAEYINAVSRPQGLTFSGRVTIEHLTATSDLKWIQQADGRVFWPGGQIISRTILNGTQIFNLPALTGDISMTGSDVRLDLHHNGASVADILIRPNGWVLVMVKARLFDLANLPWPSGSSPDDTVLQFEEQVLRR